MNGWEELRREAERIRQARMNDLRTELAQLEAQGTVTIEEIERRFKVILGIGEHLAS